MLENGNFNEAVWGPRGLRAGIDACVNARCLVPSLILIYSAIDVVSALTRPEKIHKTERKYFKGWVSKYMADFLTKVGCSAEDVYAARCGVVHTMTRFSDLSRAEKSTVKTFVYYWQQGPRPDALTPPALHATQICMEDLRDAFFEAVAKFDQAKEQDKGLAARITHHEPELLCYRPWSSVRVSAR